MRFSKSFFSSAVALLVMAGNAFAANISGKIINRDGQGVAGVRVVLGDPMLAWQNLPSARTASDGTYTLTDVRSGVHLVGPAEASKYFEPSTRRVNVPDTGLSGVNFVFLGTDQSAPRLEITSPSDGFNSSLVTQARGTASDDTNGNGVRDPGESGILGITFSLNRQGESLRTERWNWRSQSWSSVVDDEIYQSATLLPAQGGITNWSAALPPLQSGYRYALCMDVFDRALQTFYSERRFSVSDTPFINASISGRVLTPDGRGVANVPVVLARDATELLVSPRTATVATRMTDAEGRYTFPTLMAGNYVVAVTRVGAFFEPGVLSLAVADMPLREVNFRLRGIDAVPPAITLTTPVAAPNNVYDSLTAVSGTVEDDADNDGVRDEGESGVRAVGVTLTRRTPELPLAVWNWRTGSWSVRPISLLERVKLATLSGDGSIQRWSVAMPAGLSAGTYNVVAVPFDHALRMGRAASGVFSIRSMQSTFMVRGRVTLSNGEGVPDVVVRRQVPGSQASVAVRTNAAGFYEFAGVAAGTYQITPVKEGFSFTPPARTVRVTSANVGSVSFIAMPRVTTSEIRPGNYRGRFVTSNPELTGADLYLTVAANGRVAGTVHYDGDAEDEFETLSGTINPATGAVTLTSTFIDSEGLNTLTLTGTFNSVNGSGRGLGSGLFENENDFRQSGTWTVGQRETWS